MNFHRDWWESTLSCMHICKVYLHLCILLYISHPLLERASPEHSILTILNILYYILFFLLQTNFKQSNFIKNLVLIRRILTKLSRFDFIKLSFSSYVSNQNLNVQKQNAHDTQKKNNMILQEKEESAVWVEL